MPIYQYACTECGEQLEVRQSFADAALTECPACAGRLRKVLSAVGVVFKGSGFYRNDSRGAVKQGASEAGDSAGSNGSGGKPDRESSGEKAGVGAGAAGKTDGSGGPATSDRSSGSDRPSGSDRSRGSDRPSGSDRSSGSDRPASKTPTTPPSGGSTPRAAR